jgi:hypothetical protein
MNIYGITTRTRKFMYDYIVLADSEEEAAEKLKKSELFDNGEEIESVSKIETEDDVACVDCSGL